jgi:hypothetical protein
MNDERGFDRAVTRLMDGGSDATPPEVIDAVLLAVRSTPQERDLRVPWRTPRMSRFVAFGFGIAAVIVISLFAGAQLFGSARNVGSGGEPSPTPEASATEPSPSPSVAGSAFPRTECAELEADTYRAAIGDFSVTASVPAGWKGSSDPDGFNVNSRGDCLFAGGVSLEASLVSQVSSDACDGQDTAMETDTPAAVTAAFAAQTGHETIGPTDRTIGGYPASRFEFSIPGDEPICNLGPLWLTPGGREGHTMYEFDGSGSFVTVYVVDVDGSALAIALDTSRPDDPVDLTELDAIVDSLRIEP